jgi:hypothetical protein
MFYADTHYPHERRKLSVSTVEDIIQDRPFDLEDFDIEDVDRGIPPQVFDIDGMCLNNRFEDCHSQA